MAQATATLTRSSSSVDKTPLWEYQQIAANYRFVPANTPLGFIFQMQQSDEYGHFGAWENTDTVPVMILRPLLLQCGILSGATTGKGTAPPISGNINGSGAAAAAATTPVTKAPTASTGRGKVNVRSAASH